MKLTKLIVPAALIVALALFAPHANAQTMGEYATTTAGVASGGGSMGTNFGPPDLGSQTWSATSVGGSFADRVGGTSPYANGGDFESRAGSTGASASDSRWPTSQFQGADSNRFGDSSSRFGSSDRFPQRSDLSSSDRFPASRFSGNDSGLDTRVNAMGLDTHFNPVNNN
jgi:hypothetical protein